MSHTWKALPVSHAADVMVGDILLHGAFRLTRRSAQSPPPLHRETEAVRDGPGQAAHTALCRCDPATRRPLCPHPRGPPGDPTLYGNLKAPANVLKMLCDNAVSCKYNGYAHQAGLPGARFRLHSTAVSDLARCSRCDSAVLHAAQLATDARGRVHHLFVRPSHETSPAHAVCAPVAPAPWRSCCVVCATRARTSCCLRLASRCTRQSATHSTSSRASTDLEYEALHLITPAFVSAR